MSFHRHLNVRLAQVGIAFAILRFLPVPGLR